MPIHSKARLVLTALLTEGLPVPEIGARYRVHRSWIYKLKVRYDAKVEAGFQARSRRPRSSPTAIRTTAIPTTAVELVVRLRKDLAGDGLDAGPDTIAVNIWTSAASLATNAAPIAFEVVGAWPSRRAAPSTSAIKA